MKKLFIFILIFMLAFLPTNFKASEVEYDKTLGGYPVPSISQFDTKYSWEDDRHKIGKFLLIRVNGSYYLVYGNRVRFNNEKGDIEVYSGSSPNLLICDIKDGKWDIITNAQVSNYFTLTSLLSSEFYDNYDTYVEYDLLFVTKDILDLNNNVVYEKGRVGSNFYNRDIGYLKNVRRSLTSVGGQIFSFLAREHTTHYWFDNLTTSGVDLSSGNYIVRLYVQTVLSKSYEKEDIVKSSPLVLCGEYDASVGYFSYLNDDIDAKIKESGFDYSFLDNLKYFQVLLPLNHTYLQVVNLDTDEVGSYLHLFPYDATEEYGVEVVYEGLDDTLTLDDTFDSGVIDSSFGSGSTHEEALQNALQDDFGLSFEGVEELSTVLKVFGEDVKVVSLCLSNFFLSLPSIYVVGLSLAVCLFIVLAIFKVLRG